MTIHYHRSSLPALLLTITLFVAGCTADSQKPESSLWPPLEPYNSGYLKVSPVHELHYEESGNPGGKPVFVLHGGPGGSSRPIMRQFFNPEKFRIILFDQRGAGQSRPYAELAGNTTWNLVEDIEKLRVHLGIEKMMIQGGSWGSTLALAYAERYPERVTDLVLRGVFTGTDEEIDHFYHGGTAEVFPDAYEELLRALPDPGRRPLPPYLVELLTGENLLLRNRVADAWLRYEWWISDIYVDTALISMWLKENSSYAFSLIENHYMANRCFLEQNQLWDSLHKIRHIPLTIVHGRFDMPCRLQVAYRLHQQMPGSELVIVEQEGHGGDRIVEAIARAVKDHEP